MFFFLKKNLLAYLSSFFLHLENYYCVAYSSCQGFDQHVAELVSDKTTLWSAKLILPCK
jgi:hypothetical protein